MIQKRLKDTITSIPKFFSTTKYIALNLDTISSFIFKGGISIDTELVDQTCKCGFRTVIQPDGDIVNILPPSDKFSSDIYNRAYKEHYEKVHTNFKNISGSLIAVKWFISASFGLITNYFLIVASFKKYIYHSQGPIQSAIIIVFFFITTFLFQKYAVKYFLRFIFLVIRHWVKNKWLSAAGF